MDHVIKTDARLRYETYYGKETILNEHFHKFVFNYQLAYQGPNTARAQIGSRLKKKSYEKRMLNHKDHFSYRYKIIVKGKKNI